MTTKASLIGPVVHAARRTYRYVHAPGKLLEDWDRCTQEQRNECFEVVRNAESGGQTPEGPEQHYLAAIAFQCLRSLYPEPVVAAAEPATPEGDGNTEPPPARRGRHR